jgi:hypothetical protein
MDPEDAVRVILNAETQETEFVESEDVPTGVELG